MAKYWLTFRIADKKVGTLSADDRRSALYDAVSALSDVWWVQPTSFILFESGQKIGAVAAKCKAAVAPTVDLVLIREVDARSARIIGADEYPETLEYFMDYVVKV